MKNLILLVVSFLLVACNPGESSNAKNIFGNDDREAIRSYDMPFRAMGKVRSTAGSCSGTLISQSFVLTAAHCIFDGNQQQASNVTFSPNYKNGDASEVVAVKEMWWGTRDYKNNWDLDFAVLRLEYPIGDDFGFVGVAYYYPAQFLNMSVNLFGYSGDFIDGQTAGLHRNCIVRKPLENGILYSDCDLMPGASGGAMYIGNGSNAKVVAVNSHQKVPYEGYKGYSPAYSDDVANGSVSLLKARNIIDPLLAQDRNCPRTNKERHSVGETTRGYKCFLERAMPPNGEWNRVRAMPRHCCPGM